MNPVQIRCPSCNANLRLDPEKFAGKKIKCPKCATPFVVPTDLAETDISIAAESAPQKSSNVAAKPKRTPPAEEGQTETDGAENGASFAAAPASRKKKQPKVAEDEDEEQEEEEKRPARRKRKQAKKGTNLPLILGGAGGGVIVLVFLALYIAGVFSPGSSNSPVSKGNPGGFNPQQPPGNNPPVVNPPEINPPGTNPPPNDVTKQPPEVPPPFGLKPKLLTVIKYPESVALSDCAFDAEDKLCWNTAAEMKYFLHRWDTKTQKELSDPLNVDIVTAFFSPDSKRIADYYHDFLEEIRIFELPTMKQLGVIKAELGAGSPTIMFSHDGKKLFYHKRVYGSGGKNSHDLFVWDVDKKAQANHKQYQGYLFSPVLSPDGKTVLYCSGKRDDPVLVSWDLATNQEKNISLPDDRKNMVFGLGKLKVSANGKLLATTLFSRIKLLDLETGKFLPDIVHKTSAQSFSGTNQIALSDDGTLIVGWHMGEGGGGRLGFWHAPSKAQVSSLDLILKNGPQQLLFSPKGRYLAVVHQLSNERGIQLWDLFPDGVVPK